MSNNGYTPTERKILGVLEDGRPHTTADLQEAIGDELMERTVVMQHISNLRKKLLLQDHNIMGWHRYGTYYYRLVNMLV